MTAEADIDDSIKRKRFRVSLNNNINNNNKPIGDAQSQKQWNLRRE